MAEEKITGFTAEEARELRGGRDLPNYLVQSYSAGQSGGNKPSGSSNNGKNKKNYLTDKKLKDDKEHKQTFVEKAKSFVSDAVDKVTGGSQKRLERLQNTYSNAQYDDTFWGQAKANFGAGRISEAEAQAWSDYMDDPTEEKYQRAASLEKLGNDFRTRNAEALDDENVKAGWLTKNIAGYLPQMGNQLKASAAPTAALVAGGAALGEATTPIPIADAAAGAALGFKAGRTIGTGIYSYNNMRGYAFKNLVEAGADEASAKEAAEDEALISSIIEMKDEAIEQFAKIPGISKAFKKVGGEAVGAVAKSGLKKAVTEYLKNIGQEYSEEFTQEIISIANERRVEKGTTGSGVRGLLNECMNVISDMASGALGGQVTSELAQAHEAGVGGGVIGAVMFPANAAVGGVINNVQSNITEKIESQNGGATNQALNAELFKLSQQSETAQQKSQEAYERYRDELDGAYTGKILVGADGKIYGQVTGHTSRGFIMTLTDGNGNTVGAATVPNGVLDNNKLMGLLRSGSKFMTESEYKTDFADVVEAEQQKADAESVPFFNGEPKPFATAEEALNYGKPQTPASQSADSDLLQNTSYKSNEALDQDISNLSSLSNEELDELFSNMLNGNRGRNLSEKQTNKFRDAVFEERSKRFEKLGSDYNFKENLPNSRLFTTKEDALQALSERGVELDKEHYLIENGGAGWVITDGVNIGDNHFLWVPVDEYIVDEALRNDIITPEEAQIIREKGIEYWDAETDENESADTTENGNTEDNEVPGGISPDDNTADSGTQKVPEGEQAKNPVRNDERPEGQSSGRNITSYVNENGDEVSEVNIFGDPVIVKGRGSIISSKDWTPEQKSIAKKLKRFGINEVHFISNLISTDGGTHFDAEGICKTIQIGEKKAMFALFFNENFTKADLEVLYKHEFTHAVFADAYLTKRFGKDMNVFCTNLSKEMRNVVSDKTYDNAVREIWREYFSDIIPFSETATRADFTKMFKALDQEHQDLVLQICTAEIFSQLISGDVCYGAFDRSYALDAFNNTYIANVLNAGSNVLAKNKAPIVSEILDFLKSNQSKTASESTTAQQSTQQTNDTTEQSEASTGDSEKLNQPSSEEESNETTQEPEVDLKKQAQQTFGEHYNAAVEKSERLSKLRTIADRPAAKDASKLEKRRAEQFQKGMKTLKDNTAKLVSGEMTPEAFAEYYLGLNRSSDGMAAYYDSKTAERWINVQEAWKAIQESADPNNVTEYRGELDKAMSQMTRSIERIDKGMRTLERLSDSASKNKFDLKSKNIFKKAARIYARWQINPTNVFRMIDGFNKGARGDGYRIQQRIDDAVADYQTMNVEAQANLAKVKQMSKYRAFAEGKQMTNVKIGDTQLNTLQALSFIKTVDTLRATSPQKPFTISGFALDMGDGNWEFVKNTDVNIDKTYDACVAALDDVAAAYKAGADEVFSFLGKRAMTTAENINGFSPYVFEKGQYFPLWYKSSSDDGRSWSINHSIDGNLQEKRFTHERSQDNPGFLAIQPITKVVDDYITQATNYAAFGELGADLQLMNREENVNGSLSQMMAKNYGEDFAGWMKNYIDDVNEVVETDTEGINKLLKEGRNLLAQGALLFSPSVQMKQVSSYWSAAGVVKWDALTAAYRIKELPMKGKGMSNPLLKYRTLGNVDPTISEALNSGWVEKLSSRSAIFNKVANMTNVKDIRTVDNVYTACAIDVAMDYPGMDKNSKTFQMLVDQKFQEAVMNTQPIFTKQARAEYARTDNEIIRMLSMFRTQQTQNFNRLITAIGEYNAERRSGKVTSATTENLTQTIKGQINAAASFAALSIAADLLLHRTKKYRDEDGELDVGAFLERLGLNMIETSAATLWKMDDLAKWLIDKVSGGETKEYYGMSLGPISTLGDVVESIEYLIKTPSLSNLRYTAGYIGTLTGMPINNVYAMINSVAMYAKDLSGDNKEHFDDILKWTANENRPENQLVKSFIGGDTSNANDLYESVAAKATKSKSAESIIKAEVKRYVELEEIDHDDAVNLLLKYGGYDDKKDAEKEVKIYELLHSDDINYNTLGEAYRDGEITKDQVISARINIAGDSEEEAQQYVYKQDFQSKFGFSYTDMKDKYRAGKISASQAIEWRMKCGGVTRESAEEWVQAQNVFLETGYEYTSTGSASYYDSYATKETIGSNTFYERHITEFPSKRTFGVVFNDLDTNSKEKTYPTLSNRYGELGSKQTRVIFTLRDHIAKGNISPQLANEIWTEYYGYSNYNWHFVTD